MLEFLPGEFYVQRSLVGYSPWGHRESETTEWLTLSKKEYSIPRDHCSEGISGIFNASLSCSTHQSFRLVLVSTVLVEVYPQRSFHLKGPSLFFFWLFSDFFSDWPLTLWFASVNPVGVRMTAVLKVIAFKYTCGEQFSEKWRAPCYRSLRSLGQPSYLLQMFPPWIWVDTDDYSIWYSFLLSILMFPFCR